MLKKTITFAIIIFAGLSTGCVPDKFQFDKEFGKSGSNRTEFLSATDMDLDSKGNLVIADAGNTRVQVITTDGNSVMAAGEPGREGYKLQSITGIGVNPLTDDILVCDQRGNKVVRFDPAGEPNLRIIEKMRFPMDVCIDRKGNSYVIMSKQSEVYKYNANGKFLNTLGGSGKAAMLFPTSILMHKDHFFITDFGGKRIVKLAIDGTFVAEYKEKGEYEDIKGPSGMHIDKDGNLYVLDLGEVPVVIISPDGKLISKVGNFGNQSGQFLYPTGVIAKSPEEIYVLDNSRNTVLNFVKKPE
ncbi:MAG: NHL repeat-containing protein [Candidatus Riflebacteria bacterium]|nr:NHL repeat-containing protein [Candidatus Riflebacteria bacterium]